MTESDLVQSILLAFGSRRDMRIWRANCGVARTKTGALVRFGVPGQADISGILIDGRRIEIECKSLTGKQTKAQQNWQKMILGMRGIYILARSVDDVKRAFGESV